MPKNALRSRLLAHRSSLQTADWQQSSHAAQLRLMELAAYQQAKRLALYAPFKNEVDTAELFAAAQALGKQICYPLVCGEQLSFHQVSSGEQLISGSYGILEPCPLQCAEQTVTPDLIVVPGVAFDLQGHRIGFGKGYYDRYLSRLEQLPVLVGLCHDFQLCDTVPSEGHDVRMDYVVTGTRLVQVAVTGRFQTAG